MQDGSGQGARPETSGREPNIRLAILSDIRLYREGLAQVLAQDPRLAVSVTIGADPSHDAARDSCEIVLADALTLLRRRSAVSFLGRASVAGVVAFGIPEHDDTALACARIGATGLVASEDPLKDVATAATVVAAGEVYCSSRLVGRFVRAVARSPSTDPGLDTSRLTRRETEIAALLEAGSSNKAIARHLGIGVTTVKTHVHHILTKLQLNRRADAALRSRLESVA